MCKTQAEVARNVRLSILSRVDYISSLRIWPRFLLASLQIDSLRHCTSIKKLRTTVESLPSRLDDLYERTWERIKAQTEDEVSLATRAIIWLTYAYQPLSVTELQHAVAVSDEGESFDEDDITSEELIVSVCCGLIVVDQQSGIVRLVRECLLCTIAKIELMIIRLHCTQFFHKISFWPICKTTRIYSHKLCSVPLSI